MIQNKKLSSNENKIHFELKMKNENENENSKLSQMLNLKISFEATMIPNQNGILKKSPKWAKRSFLEKPSKF